MKYETFPLKIRKGRKRVRFVFPKAYSETPAVVVYTEMSPSVSVDPTPTSVWISFESPVDSTTKIEISVVSKDMSDQSVSDSSAYAGYGYNDVRKERARQDVKWGSSRNLHPQLWIPIVLEEVGEVARAVLEGSLENYREELVQLAAVALAAIQDLDWQQANKKLLPSPQLVAHAWDRMEKGLEPDGYHN